MAVLVTGGAGYIGSHVCVELLNAGFEVLVLDNLSNSGPDAVRRIGEICGHAPKLIVGDVLSDNALDVAFSGNNIEAVMHFAALKSVAESVEKPMDYYRVNVGGTLTLCRAMERHNCKKLVYSSSATVYGIPDFSPIPETAALCPENVYGRTKLHSERILEDICRADPSLSVACLRYFNPIGAHDSGLIGEDSRDIPNNLMPYIVRVAQGKLPHLNIYGSDYDTPDGTGVRDYLHVCDLAEGHVSALKYIAEKPGYSTFNLGTGRGLSVLDIVNAFTEATGIDIKYEFTGRRPGDIASYYADPSLAERMLGWRARRGVDLMCRSAWNYVLTKYKGR